MNNSLTVSEANAKPLGNDKMVVFSNSQFGDIRTILKNGEPWFVAADVCAALDLVNPRKAVSRLDDDERAAVTISDVSSNGVQQGRGFNLINEPGLYRLVLSSRKPEANTFRRWITHDVIPSIRKHGAYMTPETIKNVLTNPDFIIDLATRLKNALHDNEKLTIEVNTLTQANIALARAENTWDKRAILVALVRAYAYAACDGNVGLAFNEFYKVLQYKHHISVKIRRGRDNGSGRLLDYIREYEFDDAIKLISAMCQDKGINVGRVINDTNAKAYREEASA